MNLFLKNFLDQNQIISDSQLFLSYYAGKRMKDSEDFNRLSSDSFDVKIMTHFYESALAKIDIILSTKTPESLLLNLTENAIDGSPESASVKALITDYIKFSIATDWLFMTGETTSADKIRKDIAELTTILSDTLSSINRKTMKLPLRKLPPF